ncbi:hypothetical protein LXA43DRAFT_1082758 [Ganoderma leucocontextum]|nr:hypothetical protein LXA43DRAFT_1082758 [Ganoderma leucocontextum]
MIPPYYFTACIIVHIYTQGAVPSSLMVGVPRTLRSSSTPLFSSETPALATPCRHHSCRPPPGTRTLSSSSIPVLASGSDIISPPPIVYLTFCHALPTTCSRISGPNTQGAISTRKWNGRLPSVDAAGRAFIGEGTREGGACASHVPPATSHLVQSGQSMRYRLEGSWLCARNRWRAHPHTTRCYRELGQLFTWQSVVRDDHKLITTGPYSIVRHPSYTGFYLLVIGNVMLLASKGSWFMEAGLWHTVLGKGAACSATAFSVMVALRLFLRVDEEDQLLKNEFGEEWDEWAKKTPYRLIPFVY